MNCKDCDKSFCSLECHSLEHNKVAVENREDGNVIKIETKPIERVVKITSVINHRLVFVRPADSRDETEFVRLSCDIMKYAKQTDTLQSMPPVGTYVLANFGYYQRALVLKHVNKTKVAVAFIDFGNVETVDFHHLKMMPEQLKDVKRFATKVALSKINDPLMNDKTLKVLYDYLIRDAELEIKIAPKTDCTEVTTATLRADQWINELIDAANKADIVLPKLSGSQVNIDRNSCRSFDARILIDCITFRLVKLIKNTSTASKC